MRFCREIVVLAAAAALPGAAAAEVIETGDGGVRLEHEVTIAAPPAAVWRALTTEEGVRWLAPESHIELAIGGAFEWYFNPDDPEDRGMEGTTILSYLPEAMLSHTGEIAGSWVVWRLDEVEGGTRVRHSSIGSGAEWAERAPYFEGAMPTVLRLLAESVEQGGSAAP